jgi:hypothetical protein
VAPTIHRNVLCFLGSTARAAHLEGKTAAEIECALRAAYPFTQQQLNAAFTSIILFNVYVLRTDFK